MNNQDPQFTSKLQAWVNTPDSQKDWEEGAILLLQLSGNKIMYRNISVNPKGKAEFIKGQLQKYLNFRLQKLTHNQVCDMQAKVDDIVEKVIKPAAVSDCSASDKSAEFADFKAGKRADHDDLPAEIQALYVENLDLVHRMRELHLKLRTLSLDNATCPDSERYPFLQEIIKLDKKLHENWYTYDHFILGTQVAVEEPAPEKEDQSESEAISEEPETSVNPNEEAVNPNELTEKSEQPAPAEEPAPAEAKPKKAKATAKRTTKKAAKK